GGVSINPQINRLERIIDLLVATPGRLLDLVNQKKVDLSGIEILVLDEADRMLDMGFIHDIKKILAKLPKTRQNLLFSATFSDDIRKLADGLLNNPISVEVAKRNTASEMVTQAAYMVPQSHKRDLLVHLMKENNWQQVLIFTRTKHGANRLTEKLVKNDIPALAIHGNKSQGARTRALAEFKAGTVRALVATDIAARGLDIDQLPLVINFELPNIAEDYVHRIGRTGRAGAAGAAISLVDGEELKYLKEIEKLINSEIQIVETEGFDAPDFIEPDSRRLSRGQQTNDGQIGKKKQNKHKRNAHKQGNRKNTTNIEQRAFSDEAKSAKRRKGNKNSYNKENDQLTEHLSEAARHQAMPQRPIYETDLNIVRRHDVRRNPRSGKNIGNKKSKRNNGSRFDSNANRGR
ncbi:MAG TPA: helicase-related protein, partial [Methylophilaceae bacterium]|nr:helicase-related protein [Methylophilaceae bacterium]